MIGEAFKINFWLTLLVGGSLNCLLIWLICKKTVKEMKAYSRILLQTCILDLFMLVVAGVAEPIYIMFEGDNVFFLNGPLRTLKPPFNFIFAQLWFFGFYFSTASCAVQFLYRYLTLCRRIEVNTVYYILMLLVGVAFVLVIFVLSLPNYPHDIDSINKKFSLFWDPEDTSRSMQISLITHSNTPNWRLYSSYVIFYSLICYITIVICGIKIRRHIKRATQGFENPRFLEINRQLTIILVVQAVLPFIAIAVSNIYLVSSMFVSENTLFALVFMLIPMHWQPALSPLITLFAVKSYRKSLNPMRKASQSRIAVDVTTFNSRPAASKSNRTQSLK